MQKGSIILARHTKSGNFYTYIIVEDKENFMFRLYNVNTNNIMANFQTANPENTRSYIENKLKCTILKVS